MDRSEWYRKLPSVDRLLQRPVAVAWTEKLGAERVTAEFRGALELLREAIGSEHWSNGHPDGWADPVDEAVEQWVEQRLAELTRPSLRPVINASGVVIHTNLGRAPLAESAISAMAETARGYSNLEYDLDAGARGRRDVHAGRLLAAVLGYPAIVVNNNAAAIYLALRELAAGGEVVVSRGELIEIGDGFRIPDILESSGCRLREVGTTNRTRIQDYRAAVNEQTKALLRVHRSNFAIVGFTERAGAAELAELGHEAGLPTIDDLGSGCLYDVRKHGFEDAPVRETLDAGIDVVTFSGDKLLGGPQAGVIAGRADLIERIRRNPMFRALRVDKLTYAALGATLRDMVLGNEDAIPVLRMLRTPVEAIRVRAERLRDELVGAGVVAGVTEGQSVLGGGSTPGQGLPTWLVSVSCSDAAEAEARLRAGDPPVVVRVGEERLLADLRTVPEESDQPLARALAAAVAAGRN